MSEHESDPVGFGSDIEAHLYLRGWIETARHLVWFEIRAAKGDDAGALASDSQLGLPAPGGPTELEGNGSLQITL